MVKNVVGYFQFWFEIGISIDKVLHIYLFVLWDCNILKQYLLLGLKKNAYKMSLYLTKVVCSNLNVTAFIFI